LAPGGQKISACEGLPETISHDCRLQYNNRLGVYYFCLVETVTPDVVERARAVRRENQAPHCSHAPRLTSIDPGVRTFATGYSPTGEWWEWGANGMAKVFRYLRAYDQLQARWSKKDTKARKRYRYKRAGARLLQRVDNLVTECHRKLIKWLCTNFDVILLPKFASSQMSKRVARKINKETTRKMLTWSHYRFRQRLLSKAQKYGEGVVQVVLCTEEYTSKTCGLCGEIHQKLGGNKTFQCPRCNYCAPRDFCGARNILIKELCTNSGSLRAAMAASAR
jgi:putative transposase